MATPLPAEGQYLLFQVAGQQCAVPIRDVREILLMAELSPAFSNSNFIQGLLNLGGEAIPVLRLNRLLSLSDFEVGLYSHIILCRHQGQSYGFLSEAVKKIVDVREENLSVVPSNQSLGGHCSAVLREGKDFISCLSFASLINSLDQASLGTASQNPKLEAKAAQ